VLFDINPKEYKKDLYNREYELNEIFDALKLNERLIVIYGIRRVGKSSILRVALKETKLPHAIVDVKGLYFEHGSIAREMLYRSIVEFFLKNMSFFEKIGFKVKDFLSRIKGIHITEIGVEVEPTLATRMSFTEFLSKIDDWCGKHKKRFVLAFDEAQYLRFGGGVKYDGIIAWSVDNLPNITIIVTGSEVGLLRDFLKVDNPKAPLFGRYRREILVKRFSREQSIDFLKKGFSELKTSIKNSELEDTVNTFDGIVGWLTYYGYYRAVRKLSHRKAINNLFEEGSKLVLSELEKIITPSRKRYTVILKAVAQGISTWSDIKAYTVIKTGPISDKRFSNLLKNLVKYGYLTKENNKYKIPDPVVKHACLTLKQQ